LARRLHPHLAVIDGYNGMEGNGPTRGMLVDNIEKQLIWMRPPKVI
jgi:hypothetical protein